MIFLSPMVCQHISRKCPFCRGVSWRAQKMLHDPPPPEHHGACPTTRPNTIGTSTEGSEVLGHTPHSQKLFSDLFGFCRDLMRDIWRESCVVLSDPQDSGSPKPHPSKPHPCNMPQAKTEVALQFSGCCAAEVALQHSLFCSADVILTKSCAAASEKLQCNIQKAAGKWRLPAALLQISGSHV